MSFLGLQTEFPIIICNLATGTDTIIGTDVLGSVLPHTLDIKNGLLFAQGGASLQLHRKDSALFGRVFTVGHSSIPPYSEAVLHCSVRTTGGRALPSSGLLEGLTLFAEDTGLIVGRTLVDPSKWKVPVLVSYFSQETIVVNPFSEVGMITQVTAIQSVADSGVRPQGATGELPHHLQDLVDQTSDDLDARQRHRLAEVLLKYADIFPVPGNPLTGHTDVVEHDINTGDRPPIRCAPRRMSPQKMKKEEECVTEMLTGGQITGDFNAKLKINNDNTQQITDTNLIPISLKADRGIWTRVNRKKPNKKSIIDYILVDSKTAVEVEEIIVDEIGTHRLRGKRESDHNTLLMTLKQKIQPIIEKKKSLKKGTPEQWDQYNKLIQQQYKNKDPTNYNKLNEMIQKTLEETIGTKTIIIGSHKTKEPPKTKQLREIRKNKKKIFQMEILKNGKNKETTLKEYVNSQKELKEAIYLDKITRIEETTNKLIKEGGTKSNLFWKLRKQAIGKKNDTYETISEEGVKIENPEAAKDHIANFYENLYQAREGKESHKLWTETIQQQVINIYNTNHTTPEEVSEEELNKTIKMLKNNKATGPDQIPNEIFTKADKQTKQIYLKTINKIIQTSNIPKQWLEGEIIRLYKGKGTKGKCSNERGITLASNFGKVFERIINNRILPKVNITEAQAGGQKGKSTTDHLLILKNSINKIRSNHKPAYIAFLDVTKAYDKAWLDAMMYVMHKEGTPLDLWKIIKDLNTNLTAKLETKYGLTRKINIKDSIRQGGVLSVIQYALIMDEINKEIQKHKLGPKFDNLQQSTGCLIWMDDVALVSSDTDELQAMLNITHDIASRYHIEFGEAKSKILKIGKGQHQPDMFLGNMKLEYTQTHTNTWEKP